MAGQFLTPPICYDDNRPKATRAFLIASELVFDPLNPTAIELVVAPAVVTAPGPCRGTAAMVYNSEGGTTAVVLLFWNVMASVEAADTRIPTI